ncbi:MAG: hypothetical protein R3190_10950 [Thermoanaerobaculia bacterium]|nr:hypothetical protein [Thermoanaerobaculia bacterium]
MAPSAPFVVCVSNAGYEASLTVRKIYRLAAREALDPPGTQRVVDESGEDYLYPAELFASIDVPVETARLFAGLEP